MHILITEPIDERAVAWLRDRGLTPILMYEDDWCSVRQDIQALICRAHIVDEALMDELPELQVIGKHGVGTNTIDVVAAADRGIRVTNTPGANANAVAEHGVGLLIAASRDFTVSDHAVREGRYGDRLRLRLRNEVSGTRVGFVGGGHIGRRIAEILRQGFGCSVGVFDPYVAAEDLAYLDGRLFEEVVGLCGWAENLFVTAPLTQETRGLVAREELEALGPDGVVVVSSRGGIVDEADLVTALSSGAIYGAGIDSYAVEPPDSDHPLFRLENVILSPHMGGHTKSAREKMARLVAEQVWSLLEGGDAPLVAPST